MNKLHPSTLKNNLQALEKLNPALAKRIREEPDVDWLEVIQTKDGQPNLLIKSGSKAISAYKDRNPAAEFRKAARAMALHKQSTSIIVGIGLGYRLREYLSRMEDGHHIVMIEPAPHMLRLALSHYNFEKYILDGSLIIPSPDEHEIGAILGTLDSVYVVEEWSLTVEDYVTLRYEDYGDFIEGISKQINQVRCNVGTVMGAGHVIADNDIANLPYVIRHRGVAELAGMFRGKPAVLVSTGPSLGKHIHKLKDIRDRVVIVAVAQALRPLLAYDVTPDFICTVDFGEVNMAHLDGIMDADVPMVALNRTYAPLIQAWEGPKFICATPVPGFENTACGILQHRGWVDQGGSVSHMCLGLAHSLGCNPIIFIGQDLALGDTSHFMQADAAGAIKFTDKGMIEWDVKDPGCPVLNKQRNTMGATVLTPGYYGDLVVTNSGLLSFIRSFEVLASQYRDRKIINSTEGGAHIKGTERLPFDRAVKRYCKKPIDKSKLLSLYSPADDAEELVDRVIPLLHEEMAVLETVRRESLLGLRAAKRMKESMGNPKRLKELFAVNEKHSNAAHAAAKRNNLIGVAIFKASREIYSHGLKVDGKATHLVRNKKDLGIRIKRNELILKAALQAARSLKKTYKKSVDLLERYQKTRDASLLVCPQVRNITLDDAERYFESGNWAHPLLDARRMKKELKIFMNNTYANEIEQKALVMRSKDIEKAEEWDSEKAYKLVRYNDLVEKSREMGRKEYKYKDVLVLLRRAVRLCPKRVEARWGLATTLHHLGRIEESLVEYRKLTKRHPNNLTFQFEMGVVMLKAGQLERAMEVVGAVMEKTRKYDSFYQRVGDLYMQAGKYNEALTAYNKYLKCFPQDHEAWSRKADCLRAMDRFDAARKALKIAHRIKPVQKTSQNRF